MAENKFFVIYRRKGFLFDDSVDLSGLEVPGEVWLLYRLVEFLYPVHQSS